jgi:hypothetical protein
VSSSDDVLLGWVDYPELDQLVEGMERKARPPMLGSPQGADAAAMPQVRARLRGHVQVARHYFAYEWDKVPDLELLVEGWQATE